MKFTLSWLKEHLETDASLEEIAETLTMIGLEVEGIDNPAERLAPFTVASVISAEPHPNADKLRVCLVDTGTGQVQVVCGAPNARAGMKGVFAPSGTTIPGTGLHLKPTTIRGVESNGMLCSEREMGLSDEHTGIIDLPEDTEVGTPFAEIMGLADPVIEIAITPDRADCLGVYGIARDLAAAGLGSLHDKPVMPVEGGFETPVAVHLQFAETEPHLCPAFGYRLVRGVRNGPSPEWMQRRLRAIGLRPINILVDITNYLTFDRGRPLHVFDAAKVKGDLTVRLAQNGESLLALDGREYRFDDTMVVIADESGVESIGGIMGGERTGCDETTTDVLIESALWDPINIARTGRSLGIVSDARYRFERGVDPQFTMPGLELATKLVLDLAGGEAGETKIAGAVPDSERVLQFLPAEVKRIGGLAVEDREIKVILNRLGFWTAGPGGEAGFKVAVPSWRGDVEGSADLVEEVVRIAGLHRVPSTPMRRLAAVAKPILTSGQKRRSAARRTLAARGMLEAVTWSFVPKAHAEAFGGGAGELELANPISVDMSDMRPSLLPGLAAAAQRNADRASADVALFEVGQVYRSAAPEGQLDLASGVRRGAATLVGSGRDWRAPSADADAFDAKADAFAVLAAAGAPVDSLQVWDQAPAWYHPGRSGTLQLGPKLVLAEFGELHPGVLERLDIKGPLVGFEVYLDAIPQPRGSATRSRPALEIADLQPVRRDFAFVVDRDVNAGDLLRAAKGADKALIADVSLFDLFEGAKAEAALGAGKKSLAIEVTLQPRDKTLTDEEIERIGEKLIAQVAKATGGTLRN